MVPTVGKLGAVVMAIFVPLSVPFAAGWLPATLILYPVPTVVPAGMVAEMLPAVVPVKVPIVTGLAKLPLASDNWAVHVLLL